MARNRLTTTQIKARRKPGKLADGDGLYLQTSPAGNKTWVFVFVRGGRRREMGLGPFGSGTGQVSLAAAREKADEVRAILGRGGDPFTELASRRSTGRTFGAVAADYIKSMQAGWRNEKHQAQWRMTLLGEIGKLDKDGKPIKAAIDYCAALRKRPVADINTDDVLKVLKPIWTAKAETARRIRGRIERVLDAAKAAGERTGENPARLRGHLDLMLPKSERLQRGHHAAMPYAEIPVFLAKIRAAGGTASRALEFLILTAARSGEVRGAAWEEVQGGLWIIPASRMKAGREHRVPLTEAAQAILDRVRGKSTSSLIFPGWKANVPLSDMSLTAVMRRHGAGQYTAHGFRSAFRDWCGDCTSYPREVAEAALAHAVGDAVERAYRRGDALEKRRALMQDWADYCAGEAHGAVAEEV